MRTLERRGAVQMTLTPAGRSQVFAVVAADEGADAPAAARDAYTLLSASLPPDDFLVVHERIFATLAVESDVLAARAAAFVQAGLPTTVAPTWVEGRPLGGGGLAGVIVRAVRRTDTLQARSIRWNGAPVGHAFYVGAAEHLVIGDCGERESQGLPTEEALVALFARARAILQESGFSFADVVRTWFYVDAILARYAAFNRVRNAFFAEEGFDPRTEKFPASTAIGGKNARGAAALLNVLAVRTPSAANIVRVASPGQPEARTYGSAFARAVTVFADDVALLELSGTAAIGAAGESLAHGDGRAQFAATLAKIETLLAGPGASLAGLAAGCIFLKDEGDAPALRETLARAGQGALPFVTMLADVCRDELLLEIDGEVVLARGGTP